MGEAVIRYGDVLQAAERFLRRYRDAFTRRNREDLAQEAAIETWRRSASIRDPECAEAFARTVARRMRYHAIQRARRARPVASIDEDVRLLDGAAIEDGRRASGRSYRVDGAWVDARWAEQQIGRALRGLPAPNGTLVEAYYAGSSCRELGELHGLPPKGVKARLHRSRQRLRETFKVRVKHADFHDPADLVRLSVPNDPGGDLT